MLSKIYTRTGDKGETGLVSGQRVPKDSLRVEAYGAVDELNSVLGTARSFIEDTDISELLRNVQEDLFILGADLATPGEGSPRIPRITQEMVAQIERAIDRFDREVAPLRAFILPAGDRAASLMFLARAVARRAERRLVALSKSEQIGQQIIPYMNRLSDLLFVLGRALNARRGQPETEWHPKR